VRRNAKGEKKKKKKGRNASRTFTERKQGRRRPKVWGGKTKGRRSSKEKRIPQEPKKEREGAREYDKERSKPNPHPRGKENSSTIM